MDRKYWYWINNIPGIGNRKIKAMLDYAHNAWNLYNMEEKELENISVLSHADRKNIISSEIRKRAFEDYSILTERKTGFVFPDEKDYPSKLKEIYDMPYILYYKGNMSFNNRKNIAVVGSRNCSYYGRKTAGEIGEILSSAGAGVISGLAYGIDGEAHSGAIRGGGYTCAVMAGGVDRCYPASHYNLYMDIVECGGCIISEYPDSVPVSPGMFSIRNRIISGIADAVIVVEAGRKSGSLITVSHAVEQNRDVYVVPGRLGDRTSEGCNLLISEGAAIITGYESMLEELGLKIFSPGKSQDSQAQNTDNSFFQKNIVLARPEKMLYSQLLDFIPKNLETLIQETGLGPKEAVSNLVSLELKGFIKELSKNFYIRIK